MTAAYRQCTATAHLPCENLGVKYCAIPADTQASNLALVTPSANFAAQSQGHSINQRYGDKIAEIVGPCDVYHEAERLCRQEGMHRVIAVGCGSGEQLVQCFPAEHYNIFGLDSDQNLSRARWQFPQRSWISVRLHSPLSIEQAFAPLADALSPTMLLLSDVLEHLPDPRFVLRTLRWFLTRNSRNRCVMATPDRERTPPGGCPTRPPTSAMCAREA